MYEHPDLCPYTELCDSFQTINRSERWIEEALAKLRRGPRDSPTMGDGPSIETLERQLEHMRRVKRRCYHYCSRCLRYRQFRAREKEEPILIRRGLPWLSKTLNEEALAGPSSGRS